MLEDVVAGMRQSGILMSAHPARDLVRGDNGQLAPPRQVFGVHGPCVGCGSDEAST